MRAYPAGELTGFAPVFRRVLQGNFMVARARIRQVADNTGPGDPPDNDEIGTVDLEQEDDPEADALAELRGLGAGGEHKYTVSRVSTEPGKRAGYCKTYAVGDLSLDTIREEFGGGKYRIRVTDAGGKYVTMQTVDIVDLPKPVAAPVAAIAPGADLAGIAALLQSVKPAGGDSGMAAVLAALIASQGEMMKAIAAGNKQQGPSVMEIIAMMKTLQPEKSATDPVELLMRGLELGKGMAGGGESSMLDIAREGLGIIGPLIKQGQPAPGQPAAVPQLPAHVPGRPVVLPANPANPATPAPEGENVKLLQQIQWMRKQVEVLLHHAARQKNPELYAEVLLDNLPPFITAEDIMQHIGAEDAVAQLARLDPRVNQYAAWFEEFREAIADLLTPEDEPAAGAPGDIDAPGEGGE